MSGSGTRPASPFVQVCDGDQIDGMRSCAGRADVHEKVASIDYTITMKDVKAWEKRHVPFKPLYRVYLV
jgi:hypothetical protein